MIYNAKSNNYYSRKISEIQIQTFCKTLFSTNVQIETYFFKTPIDKKYECNLENRQIMTKFKVINSYCHYETLLD